MTVVRTVFTRLVWSVIAFWIALTGTFFAFALSPDDLQWKRNPGATEAYREARNYNDPLLDRYTNWMEGYLQLDLGTTVSGEPVGDVLATNLEHTLAYLGPSLVLAAILATGLGFLLARRRGKLIDSLGSATVYFLYGIPAFVFAALIYWGGVEFEWYNVLYNPDWGFYSSRNLPALIPPALIVTASMLGVWFRYARMEFVTLLEADFIKTLHANGAGSWTVFVHLLRNASKTLVTAMFVELVTVMVITTVVVETILEFPGYGRMVYDAVFAQDIGLIMGSMLVPMAFAVLGNLIQDVVYPILDPRLLNDEQDRRVE